MNRALLVRSTLSSLAIGLVCLLGCSQPTGDQGGGDKNASDEGKKDVEQVKEADAGAAGDVEQPETPAARVSTAENEDVVAAKDLLDAIGDEAMYKIVPDDVMTELIVRDGSILSAEDIALFGKLTDLEVLQIYNFRDLDDEMAAEFSGLSKLNTLALTNSAIGDPTVEMIAASFPDLASLDLSYNTNISNSSMKLIAQLSKLTRLTLIQDRFNDVGMSSLVKLNSLEVLDIRGNMEAGDLTLQFLGTLPNLAVLKHRSTTVSDYGIECLTESKSLKSLLMHDFLITSQAGESLAMIENLSELEIFRCQNFGSEGVLALKGMPLTRLKLRDLPAVDDRAMPVFEDLPALEKLYLHELSSVSDEGLRSLGNLKSLKVLDIWSVPQMTDASVEVIATLPELKELSIRSTGVSDAAVDTLLAMPKLHTLVLKDNGSLTDEGLKKLATKDWKMLDVGQ